MSTVRYASILAIFAIFLCECIDKMNKKVHNKFTNECRHIQEHGFALRREVQRNGVQFPDAERHCKVYALSDWRSSAVTRVKPGKALRKERAKARTPSQDIRFLLFLAAFPPERYAVHKNVCTKVFSKLWCFFIAETGGSVRSHSLQSKE